MIKLLPFILTAVVTTVTPLSPIGELEEISTPPPPPRPYAFGYAAGRFPGHIDRLHTEQSDGGGIVRGSYSYVDPRYQIRTVDYIADKNGFHPILNKTPSPLPKDSPVVAAAKRRHLALFSKIAESNSHTNGIVAPLESAAVSRANDRHFILYQKIAEEHARIAAQLEAQRLANEGTAHPILENDA